MVKYLIVILILFSSCGDGDRVLDIVEDVVDIIKEDPTPSTPPENTLPPEVVKPTSEPIEKPIEKPIETPKEYDLFIPNNCSNPPKNISSNDGFKCMASATRNGTVVCLLPYQFTWKPWKQVTDHHNNTFTCNKSEEHFDKVFLIMKSGRQINLVYAGCHNYVATSDGWIGRQHFRNEDIKWGKIKRNVKQIVMIKNKIRTCLKF